MHARNNPGSRSRIERISVPAARFVHALGHVIGYGSAAWSEFVPMRPQTRLSPGENGVNVEFTAAGTPKYPVDGPARTLVTYGPGMTGILAAGETEGVVKEAHFVSGGVGARFVSEYTELARNSMQHGLEGLRRAGTLKKHMKGGGRAEDVSVPTGFYYNEGIAESIDRIAAKTVERGEPVDVVLMSAVHSAGAQEGIAGVEGAHRLLRQDGLLVVKAPDISVGDEGGLDVLSPVAARLFGAPAIAGACGELSQYTDPSQPTIRSAGFAIYRK